MIDVDNLKSVVEEAIRTTLPTTAKVFKVKENKLHEIEGHIFIKEITGVFYKEESKVNVVIGDTVTKSKINYYFLIPYDGELLEEENYRLFFNNSLYNVEDLGENFKIYNQIQIAKSEEVLNVIQI